MHLLNSEALKFEVSNSSSTNVDAFKLEKVKSFLDNFFNNIENKNGIINRSTSLVNFDSELTNGNAESDILKKFLFFLIESYPNQLHAI